MKRIAVALALACAGCGFSVGGSDNPIDARQVDGSDSAVDSDGPGPDSAPEPAPGACESMWQSGNVAFDQPVVLTGLGPTTYDSDPWVSHDELTIYWVGGTMPAPPPGMPTKDDVFTATRLSKTSPFSNPMRVTAIDSAGDDSKAALTVDELDVILSAVHPPKADTDFYEARRTTKTDPFSLPDTVAFTNINTADPEYDPHLDPSGLRLYYSKIEGGKQKIVLSERASRSDVFSAPVLVPVVNDGTNPTNVPIYAADPSLSENEHIILFTTDKTATKLGGNMWYATR
ncbi:MAG TPA: hypothetical protein VGM39_16600, partial [Kofleriaceae bacterium]